MKRFLLSLSIVSLLGAGIVFWALWIPGAHEILQPLPSSGREFNLKADRSSLGTQPILVVIDTRDSNVFARYIAEILKAEGIFAFESIDLSTVPLDSSLVSSYALVISATNSAHLQQNAHLLMNYVHQGGRLLMLSPPVAFDSLLGIRGLNLSLNDGYVRFDSGARLAHGLVDVPLRFFGAARLCSATTSTVVAQIAQDSTMSNRYPGFGINTFGGGMSGYAMFDIGRSVVFTRQGRPPDRPGTESPDKDGDGVLRTADLFFDTFEFSRTFIPQADEQQRLFANIVYELLECRPVVPRIWYFPNGQSSVALVTGDAHYTATTVIRRLVDYIERRGGRFTLIDFPGSMDTSLGHRLQEAGHTVAPHIYHQRRDNLFPMRAKLWVANGFSPSSFYRPRLVDLRDEVRYAVDTFRRRIGGSSQITRTHFLVWWGWTETARLLAENGFRMDLSITGMNPHETFLLPSSGELKSPSGFGYINGSGQPMRFINEEGKLIDLFSQLTQVEDDVAGATFITRPSNDSMVVEQLSAVTRKLIDESVDRYNTVLVWNFHPYHTVERFPPEVPVTWPWVTATIDHLEQRGVPMLSAETWLRFVEGRYNIRMSQVRYDDGTRTGRFTLSAPYSVAGVTLLIPLPGKVSKLRTLAASIEAHERQQITTRQSIRVVNNIAYAEVILDLPANLPITIRYSF